MEAKWSSIFLGLFLAFILEASAWGSSDKVKLKDVEVLTLKQGYFTAGRRSAGVPQIRCVGGTAGCQAFVPQVVQCYNRGSDGEDIQWECKTDMDNAYRFGSISVTCEGYDYPDDPYILKGSCGLEYTMDLTAEGYDQKRSSPGASAYGWKDDLFGGSSKPYNKKGGGGSSVIETIALFLGVAIVVYAVYRTCIAPVDRTEQRSTTNDDYPGRPGGSGYSAAPPPGFRSDYYPSSSGGGDSCGAQARNASGGGAGSGAGGFWTGAATGGLLGYMFGARNTGGGGYTAGPSYARPSTSWGSYDSWGGSGGGGGASSSGAGSSGTRSASGFGGTRRR